MAGVDENEVHGAVVGGVIERGRIAIQLDDTALLRGIPKPRASAVLLKIVSIRELKFGVFCHVNAWQIERVDTNIGAVVGDEPSGFTEVGSDFENLLAAHYARERAQHE